MTHICVSKLTIIGSDNGLSPGRHQAIIWTNAGILLIGPLGTNFNETSIEIHTFSFQKIHLKLSSGKWRPFCLGLNVLTWQLIGWQHYWIQGKIQPRISTHLNLDLIGYCCWMLPSCPTSCWLLACLGWELLSRWLVSDAAVTSSFSGLDKRIQDVVTILGHELGPSGVSPN